MSAQWLWLLRGGDDQEEDDGHKKSTNTLAIRASPWGAGVPVLRGVLVCRLSHRWESDSPIRNENVSDKWKIHWNEHGEITSSSSTGCVSSSLPARTCINARKFES